MSTEGPIISKLDANATVLFRDAKKFHTTRQNNIQIPLRKKKKRERVEKKILNYSHLYHVSLFYLFVF